MERRPNTSKALIVYFSQGRTTARVAEAIAAGLRAAGRQVDLHNLKDGPPPEARNYDLFGIGFPVYYFRPPFNVTDYLNSLPELDGLPAFVFVLQGSYRGDAGTMVRRALARKRACEVGYFHCYGADYYMGYLKHGYLFSPGHPVAGELAQAESFGREVAARLAGQPYQAPAPDPPPYWVHRLERFLTNRWLVRHVQSRQFSVDRARCNACDACFRLCPTGNLARGEGGRPVWGRNCLLCLTCQMKCPQDAITSADTRRFSPGYFATLYNVRHTARDPSIDLVRVVHSRGRTREV